MRSGQLKCCQRMIKCSSLPTFGGVALSTVLTKLTVMGVILIVAGNTFVRRTLENASCMARLASHVNMRAIQLKSCQRMVKGRLFPPHGRMALSAILPKAPFMRVVWGVAGRASLRRGLEVCNRAGASMACAA